MNEPSLVRRLTTIVAIDVVGFSTLSARNEEHALGLLRTRMAIAETYIKQHRGRVFKMTGDGLLAEFASPVEAVRAAVEIQEAMRTTNALATEADRLNLRIGANLGDVVEAGDDLMGDAVNVAVRLESIAPVGGICVSATIYEQIVGKLTLGAEDMGEQQVKNIPRPIRAYRLMAEGAAPMPHAAARSQASTSKAGRIVLAVSAVVVVAAAAIGGGWLLRGATAPVAENTAAPPVAATSAAATTAATTTAATVAPPPARSFAAADVPFLTDRARRDLETYAGAEGAKALAINIRGNFSFATRRIDEPTARRIALDQCNAITQRNNPVVRDIDRCSIYAAGNTVVWTFRMPALPPSPLLPSTRPAPPIGLDPASIPLMSEAGRNGIGEHYMKAQRDRALALGRNRTDTWATGDSGIEASRRALQSCGHITGRPCFIYALGDQVIVRVPQNARIIDVFTPQDLTGLDRPQQEAAERYLVADDWRAIAVGRNGRIGIVAGRASEDAAVDAALRECARAGGSECAVTAIGPYLVTRN